MPIVHDRLAQSDFPFPASRASLRRMTGADLTLRFGRTRVRANVCWPTAGAESLTLLLTDECSRADVPIRDTIVVALSGAHDEDLAALHWIAEHAADLGARPDQLLVAGGARAAWLAVSSRDIGWPVLLRQLLVCPTFTPEYPMPPDPVGVAPATVVTAGAPRDDGSRYAARLREAGVEVEELRR